MSSTKKRCVIVFDGESWFVRELHSATHDLDADHKIYRCSAPVSGPWKSVGSAANSAKSWLRKP
jgi:hypothetical protein